jgi:hypothetical protein
MSNIVKWNFVCTTVVTCKIVEGLCNARTYVIDETEFVTENTFWNIEKLPKFLNF